MNKKIKTNVENIFKNIFKILLMTMFLSSIGFGIAGAANNIPVCGNETNGTVRCFSNVIADDKGTPKIMAPTNGYSPANFLSAYNLNGNTDKNQIIAIVDAYDNPKIISDLNTYNNQFGLPSLGNCAVSTGTTTSPCFQKVDQRGGTNYPIYDSGWALEIALDVEIAHAICQNCNILLVEADTNSYDNIMIAFDKAVSMGANIISNSYGSGEFDSETSLDSHFNLPGKVITFSTGDGGWGTAYPAASPYVTSVGGTTLNLNPRTEGVWGGTGSGCSLYESKPSFQTDTGCAMRTIGDVAADADPNTGAAIYDSSYGGWFKVGGTSLSSPLIAGVYALSGGFNGYGNSVPYSRYSYGTNLNDITSGNNGNCGTYLCNGVSGYDGPTGLGTPIGTGAFGEQRSSGIAVTSPNGGEIWQSGSTQTVKWSYTGNPGSFVKIDLLKGGYSVKTLTSSVSIGSGGSGTYSWKMLLDRIPGNDYQIRITSTSNSAYTDTSDNYFTISGSQVQVGITVNSPNGGESWKSGNTKTVKWKYKNVNSNTKVNIDLLQDGIAIKRIASNVKGGSYNWKIGKWSGNNFKIKIKTIDDKYTDTSDNNFIIST